MQRTALHFRRQKSNDPYNKFKNCIRTCYTSSEFDPRSLVETTKTGNDERPPGKLPGSRNASGGLMSYRWRM